MFALIITILSIALVAALALATIYYGGTAFNRNSTEIKAAEIMLQQQQIRAAISLYQSDHEGASPQNLNQLITEHYLRQTPTYVASNDDPSLFPAAQAANAVPWIMPVEHESTFILAENVTVPVCAEVNFKARAFRGVPNQLYTSLLPVQCYYSTDKQSNIVVVSDHIKNVVNVLTGVDTTPTDPSKPFLLPLTELNPTATTIDPADPSKWQTSPSELTTGGTGGTGGTGSNASNFNVTVFCSECGSSSTENMSAKTTFTRTVYVSASNITASQAGTPISVSISSAFPHTVTCVNPTFAACDSSNPNNVLFTPAEGSSADVTLLITYTPSRLTTQSLGLSTQSLSAQSFSPFLSIGGTPGPTPTPPTTSTTATTSVSAQVTDTNAVDNAFSYSITATNLDAIVADPTPQYPPYTGYTAAGEMIIYEGYNPVDWNPLKAAYFNGEDPTFGAVVVVHRDGNNWDQNNFMCDHSFIYSSCYLRPSTYPEGHTTITFMRMDASYYYTYTDVPVYITHAPNPYQAEAVAGGRYPPMLWQ